MASSRRRVEITYQANTRQAVAEISKFAKASTGSLQSIQRDTAKATSAISKMGGAMKALGATLVFSTLSRGFRAAVAEAREIWKETERWRGKNDELVQSAERVYQESTRVEAAIGTVVLGAAKATGVLGTLEQGFHSLSDAILSSDTTIGKIVRGPLHLLVDVIWTAIDVSHKWEAVWTEVTDNIQIMAADIQVAWTKMVEATVKQLEEIPGPLRELIGGIDQLVARQELMVQGAEASAQAARNEANAHRSAAAVIAAAAESRRAAWDAGIDQDFTLGGAPAGPSGGGASGMVADFLHAMAEADAQRGTWYESLAETLGRGAAERRSGGRGGGSERAAVARALGERAGATVAGATKGSVYDPKNAAVVERQNASKLGGTLGSQALAGSLGGSAGASALGGAAGGRAGEVAAEMQAAQEQLKGLNDMFTSELGGMSTSFFSVLGQMAGGLKDWGSELKATLAQTLGSIGSSLTSAAVSGASILGMGPLGIFALGGLFSVAAGLLGGPGGSSAGARRGRAAGGNYDVSAQIRPEVSRGSQSQVVQLSIGAVFSRDESRKAVAGFVREAQFLGEMAR